MPGRKGQRRKHLTCLVLVALTLSVLPVASVAKETETYLLRGPDARNLQQI